jgi:hypothetical protein
MIVDLPNLIEIGIVGDKSFVITKKKDPCKEVLCRVIRFQILDKMNILHTNLII